MRPLTVIANSAGDFPSNETISSALLSEKFLPVLRKAPSADHKRVLVSSPPMRPPVDVRSLSTKAFACMKSPWYSVFEKKRVALFVVSLVIRGENLRPRVDFSFLRQPVRRVCLPLYVIYLNLYMKLIVMPIINDDHYLASCAISITIAAIIGAPFWGFIGDLKGFKFTFLLVISLDIVLKFFGLFCQ